MWSQELDPVVLVGPFQHRLFCDSVSLVPSPSGVRTCSRSVEHAQCRGSLLGTSHCFILQKFPQTFDSFSVQDVSCSISFTLRFKQEQAWNLKQRPMSLTCVHISPINQPRHLKKFVNLRETLNEPELNLQARCTVFLANNSQHAAQLAR